MKILLEIIALAILAFLLHLFLPWWIILVAAAILGFVNNRGSLHNFGIGFLGAALLWGMTAGWIDYQNGGLLSDKMGQLFGGVDGQVLLLISALLGGILGGLGAMTGSLGRQLMD